MRTKSILILAALALFALGLAACGGEDPTPTPAPTPTSAPTTSGGETTGPAPTPTSAPTTSGGGSSGGTSGGGSTGGTASQQPASDAAFQRLLAEARATTDREVIGWYDGTDPATIRAWEEAFEAEFGIDITVSSIPGHGARDAPIQALQAYKAGKAIADDQSGNADILLDMLHEGALRQPDWEALYGVSPLIQNYREALILDSNLGPMKDWCMVSSFYVWPLAYNTNNVTAEELEGITFDDLAYNPVWKDRVVTDARFLGVYAFPMAPGWDDDRQLAWVRALRENGAKAVSGGSTGVVQALLAGEGDIAIASSSVALREQKKGAPVDWWAPADGWVPGGIGLTCYPTLTTTSTALADLWSAWQATTGAQLQADLAGGFVTAPGVVNEFTQKLSDLGLDLPRNLVYAYKPEDVANLGRWRQQAIDAFTE